MNILGVYLILTLIALVFILIYKIKNKKSVNLKTKENSDFQIEHYPESARYYPKYKGQYLYLSSTTGMYSLRDSMAYAQYSKSMDRAMYEISCFKEIYFKNNLNTIDV